MTNISHPYRLLFLCLGNICRSPAAHGIMQKMVDDAGLGAMVTIDSAGIGDWHVGQLPDPRMRDHGRRHGYTFDHRARQFHAPEDFSSFDYIIVMDDENYRTLDRMAHTQAEKAKILRMGDYLSRHPRHHYVPDPYYGDGEDFELAIELIEDGCAELLRALQEQTL